MKKTVQVSVADITADLKSGTPDTELMRKYGLSEIGLKRLFDRLLHAMSSEKRQIEVESE